jgi:NAD(P)H-dependent flavin oxidoreductase YrpB (nitropropane dioxygenase family)
MFTTRYPIIAAAMNQVSDLNLAIACERAGIVASISAFNYIDENGRINFDSMSADLKTFVMSTKSKNLIFSISTSLLKISNILEIIKESNFGAIEVAVWNPDELHLLKDITVPVFLKTTGSEYYEKIKDSVEYYFDAIILKGKSGAGTVNFNLDLSLKEMFLKLKNDHPEILIIPSGGISTSKEIQEFLDIGARYVSIGTLFAFSKESKISTETKEKIVVSKSSDIEVFKKSSQNAIKFSNVDGLDNFNNTKSLKLGIQSPKTGHIFVGAGIDQIKKIKAIDEIVQTLVTDLNL